jgi:hypothetical protein
MPVVRLDGIQLCRKSVSIERPFDSQLHDGLCDLFVKGRTAAAGGSGYVRNNKLGCQELEVELADVMPPRVEVMFHDPDDLCEGEVG